MSEDRDDTPEEIDLSDVPMDGADEAPGDNQEGEEKKDGEGEEGDKKTPLAAEELEKRYSSTRVALSTERAKRRELERRLEALERGDRGEPAQPQQRREEPEEIDPDVDPVGALKQMRAKIAAYEAAERQADMTAAQRQEQEQRFQRVEAALQEHEADFKEDHPDYDDAAKHYAVTRAQELMQFGMQPSQIQGVLREEFANLANTAMRAGKNPAAVVYEMAKGRGYGKPAAPKEGDAKQPGKIDALKRGERASSPLGRSGGRTTTGLDVSTVANINIRDRKGAEAFDKAFEALEREAKRAERGGR